MKSFNEVFLLCFLFTECGHYTVGRFNLKKVLAHFVTAHVMTKTDFVITYLHSFTWELGGQGCRKQ